VSDTLVRTRETARERAAERKKGQKTEMERKEDGERGRKREKEREISDLK